MKLLTIGHSNHTIERLVQLLEAAGVATLVDVRTSPASRFNPQFNQGSLEAVLAQNVMTYVFAGRYLGGRPADPTCYKQRVLPPEGTDYLHEVDYPEVMRRDWFVKGIQRLLAIADEQTTAIMCSEENPAECHRHHLIAKYLFQEYPDRSVPQVIQVSRPLLSATQRHLYLSQLPGWFDFRRFAAAPSGLIQLRITIYH
jgi:uncharacterized protein (DUF488 family)